MILLESSYLDQTRQNVGPDLGPNCLQQRTKVVSSGERDNAAAGAQSLRMADHFILIYL